MKAASRNGRRIICALSWALAIFAVTGGRMAQAAPPLGDAAKLEYRPVNRTFWQKVNAAVQSGNANAIFKAPQPNGPQSEKDEWKLGIARALAVGGNTVHAQYLLTGVAVAGIGTRQGAEALRILHEIARDKVIDETYLEELAFNLDAKIDDPQARSLIAYFRARSLGRKGYPEWTQTSLNEVVPGTTWADELQFDRTLQLLNSGDSANAYGRFESLANSQTARKQTIQLAKLALARLIFERRDFKASIATYMNIDLPLRERARSLNELAWAYYYDHAYGKALGVIRALKSPYFEPLLSPETLVLEMLVYRELCYFQLVKSLSRDFVTAFKPVFTAIEERQNLETVPQFMQMALQDGVLQRRALGIQQVRAERRQLDRQQTADLWAEKKSLIELLKFGEKRERIADAEITRRIHTKADQLGNWFLDLREQAWFLEYESSMRMIQLNDDEKENYTPPRANKVQPETLFWPVGQETWLDELLDYEYLVKDQCGVAKGGGH